MNDYTTALKSIITHQELIIGPVAIEEANKVDGLTVVRGQGSTLDLVVSGDSKEIMGNLVQQYASLFGRVSVEVCKEALSSLPSDQKAGLPDILK